MCVCVCLYIKDVATLLLHTLNFVVRQADDSYNVQ